MPILYNRLLLPQNYIAEEILIGSIIINPTLLNFVNQNIDTEYFFLETHRVIYRNLITQSKNNKNHIDPVNFTYFLKEQNILHHIGGIQLITELIKQGQIFNSSKNVHFYTKQIIKIIHDNYSRRLIIQYGFNIVKLAYNYNFSNYMLYIKASQYLKYIYSKNNSKNLDNLQDLIGFLISNIQNNNNISQLPQHLYSGFTDLDILTNGLPNGDLIVIAGRPSMGKTSFVMNITYHLIKYYYTQVCIFSLEMTKIQILHKLISIGSNISIQNIVSKNFNNNEWNIIQKVCNEILCTQLYINDNSNISIDEIKYLAQIIICKNKRNQTIIIDYLQLIHINKLNMESRNQELSYITRELKILAQELKIPIIILSQLNRNIDKRVNKTPLLSDLKESGCINIKLCLDGRKENKFNIKTIIKARQTITLYSFSVKSYLYNHYLHLRNNYNYNIYISYQYTFLCKIYSHINIIITNNHKYLKNYKWVKQRQLKKNYTVLELHRKTRKTEKTYIQHLLFHEYYIVFDITKYKYTNVICNNIILHNSIEQDADIVMMLYKNTINQISETTNLPKTIDIIISKNRNGPIGALKLNFYPETTIFTSAINSYNLYIDEVNN